jgi:thiol:disulfide interchange protein DsbD
MSFRRLLSIVLTVAWLTTGLHTSVSLAQLETRSPTSFSATLENRPVPLELEQAFPFFVSEVSPGHLRVTWDIAEGHYLYRHAFDFSLRQSLESESVAVLFSLPDGVAKTDQFFGKIEAYYDLMSAELELGTVPGPATVLLIQYQGCAEWGFCYPPQRAEFKLIP